MRFVPSAMPRITRLEPQARRANRVNVHLDGAYAFSLTPEVAATLTVGQELDAAAIGRLRAADDYRRALDRALGYLGRRPRSRHELTRYLTEHQVTPEVVTQVLGRLEALGLVDDAAFAAWWVENRAQHRPRGARALAAELAAKGVDRTTRAAATGELDEAALARRLALDHCRRYRGLTREVFERRLGGLLARRGFSYEAIRAALEAAWAATHAPGEAPTEDAF